MRARKDVCTFCRYVFRPPRKNVSALRSAYSTADEPYVLPRLVIDLDASDSKFVHKLDEDEATGSNQNVDVLEPSRNAVAGEPVRVRRRLTSKGKQTVSFNTESVGPPDLLRYAILGDPSLSPNRGNEYLRKIFERGSIIPTQFGGDKVLQLLSHFSTDPGANLARAGFNRKTQHILREPLRTASSFTRLERIVSMLCTTTMGCEFLAFADSEIIEGIRLCRKSQDLVVSELRSKPTAWMVLNLLNNLRLNMISKGVKFPASLCNAGLYYASKIGFTPAVKSYLDEIIANSHAANWHAHRAMINLQNHCGRGNSAHDTWAPWLTKAERRDLSIGLLTGYASPDGDLQGDARSPCFADLIDLPYDELFGEHEPQSFDRGIYCTYITGLGELGLSNVLWDEWMASGSSNVRVKQLNGHPIAELFVFSFLLAKDRSRALSVVEIATDAQEGMDRVGFTDLVRFSPRARTLMKILQPTPESMPQSIPFLQKLIRQHYWRHVLQPEQMPSIKIEELDSSHHSVDVLADIEKLLSTGYDHGPDRSPSTTHKTLDSADSSVDIGLRPSTQKKESARFQRRW